MNEEKAAKTLTKELGDKVGRIFVVESHYKSLLLKNALTAYQIDNPIMINHDGSYFSGSNFNRETDIKNVIPYVMSKLEANYFFMESIPVATGSNYNTYSRFAVTPYSIIGNKEKLALREIFYKNVPPEITNSMDTLDIKHFVGLYKSYQNKELCCLDTHVNKILEDVNALKEFIDKTFDFEYDKDDEVNLSVFEKFGGISSLNDRLARIGVTERIIRHKEHTSYVARSVLSKVIKEAHNVIGRLKGQYYGAVSNEFIHFVFFSLQREDQSIDFNKEILKNSLNLDFVVNALSKEYAENGNFCEYFDVLDKEAQERVVNTVKNFSNKNTICDSFLWSKGFKDLSLNHLELYKNDSKGFIEYFTRKTLEEKKAILKDVMDCEFTNEGAIDWLNENEQDLIREVGFNG